MQIQIEQDEAQFVKYVLSCMRALGPREKTVFGYKKADVPTMERGILTLSTNPAANYQFVEFMQTAIEMKQEVEAPEEDINSSIKVMEKVKNAIAQE